MDWRDRFQVQDDEVDGRGPVPVFAIGLPAAAGSNVLTSGDEHVLPDFAGERVAAIKGGA